AGEDDERAREVREPELAHEEVMELERELACDVAVGPLLVRQADVEADGAAALLRCAAVGRLHDAAAAPRADDVAPRARRQALRPPRDEAGELPRRLVITSERPVGRQARGAEEHDGVVDLLAAERLERLEVLGEDAQRPRRVAL